jgi:hypothetical protein
MDDWDDDDGYGEYDDGGWQEEGYDDDDVVYAEYDEYTGEYHGDYDDDDSDVKRFEYEQSSNPLTGPANQDDNGYDDCVVWTMGYEERYDWQEAEYQRQTASLA